MALCPPAETLEQQLNASFAAQRPSAVKKRRWRLAIDLHWRPDSGQAQQRVEELYRSRAKHGTTRFHAYATCYLVHHGRRDTVALTGVEKGTALVEVLKRLLRCARHTGVRPKRLLLDRGFYSVPVIRSLQAARYPFIMPAIIRGRQAAHPKGPSGTRVFALWKRSGWSSDPLTRAHQRKATVRIAVHGRHRRGQCRRQGRQTLVYAFWGIAPKTTQWVFHIDRHRFGIETRYRPLGEACIKTTTRNPTLQLLFVDIALLLRTVWVWVLWVYLATPRRGGRQLNWHSLRFKTLLMWLTHLAEETFGTDDTVVAAQVP